MNLEELSKTQTILLAVLVSFVTSIATGIVATSFLNEAPAATFGQTVHKVVERTVKKVVPNKEDTTGAENATTVKETTVVVRESDMIMESINKNTKNLVRLYEVSDTPNIENSASTSPESSVNSEVNFAGLGVVISEDGLVVTPTGLLTKSEEYEARFYDGRKFNIQKTNVGSDGLTLVKILKKNPNQKFSRANIVKPSTLNIGKKVITLSGEESRSVAVGIISRFSYEEVPVANKEGVSEEKETAQTEQGFEEKISLIHTDINSSEVLPGSPLITIFNKVAGVVLKGKGEHLTKYVPSYIVKKMIKEYRNIQNENMQESKDENKEN